MPTVATESTVKIHHLDIQEVPSAPSIIQAIPPTAQQTHVVYTKIQKMARHSNKPFGYFNQTTWRQQQDPPVPLTYLPRSKWDKNQLAISTGSTPTWIDFVINNLDEGSHPFHLVRLSLCLKGTLLTSSSPARSQLLHSSNTSIRIRLGLIQPLRRQSSSPSILRLSLSPTSWS